MTSHHHDRLQNGRRRHYHDHTGSLDDAVMVSKAGTRALAISLSGLAVTALLVYAR